jgi:hypothetical protein
LGMVRHHLAWCPSPCDLASRPVQVVSRGPAVQAWFKASRSGIVCLPSSPHRAVLVAFVGLFEGVGVHSGNQLLDLVGGHFFCNGTGTTVTGSGTTVTGTRHWIRLHLFVGCCPSWPHSLVCSLLQAVPVGLCSVSSARFLGASHSCVLLSCVVVLLYCDV